MVFPVSFDFIVLEISIFATLSSASILLWWLPRSNWSWGIALIHNQLFLVNNNFLSGREESLISIFFSHKNLDFKIKIQIRMWTESEKHEQTKFILQWDFINFEFFVTQIYPLINEPEVDKADIWSQIKSSNLGSENIPNDVMMMEWESTSLLYHKSETSLLSLMEWSIDCTMIRLSLLPLYRCSIEGQNLS